MTGRKRTHQAIVMAGFVGLNREVDNVTRSVNLPRFPSCRLHSQSVADCRGCFMVVGIMLVRSLARTHDPIKNYLVVSQVSLCGLSCRCCCCSRRCRCFRKLMKEWYNGRWRMICCMISCGILSWFQAKVSSSRKCSVMRLFFRRKI